VTRFRVVSKTTRWTGHFLRVEDLEIEGPDGVTFTRAAVRHPGAVAVVPVDNDGRHVILVRQYRSAVDRELLEIPAGKRDVDGEPPEETALRELEEEIGQRAGRLVRLGSFMNSPGFTDEYTHLFCALDLEPTQHTWTGHDEEAEMTIERVAIADLDDLIANEEIIDGKTLLGLKLARPHLDGHSTSTR